MNRKSTFQNGSVLLGIFGFKLINMDGNFLPNKLDFKTILLFSQRNFKKPCSNFTLNFRKSFSSNIQTRKAYFFVFFHIDPIATNLESKSILVGDHLSFNHSKLYFQSRIRITSDAFLIV